MVCPCGIMWSSDATWCQISHRRDFYGYFTNKVCGTFLVVLLGSDWTVENGRILAGWMVENGGKRWKMMEYMNFDKMTERWNIVENQKTDWMVEYGGKLTEWWNIVETDWMVENGGKLTEWWNMVEYGGKLTEWWNMLENWLNGGKFTEWWNIVETEWMMEYGGNWLNSGKCWKIDWMVGNGGKLTEWWNMVEI